MKINKQILVIPFLASSMALSGHALAFDRSTLQDDSASSQTMANDAVNKAFSNSTQYSKNRDANSSYNTRASDLIGQTVERSNGDNIGEIDDLIYSSTNSSVMAIISVGGFLGMGEKLVSVPYTDLRVSEKGDQIFLDTTKEALKSKAGFSYNEGETTGREMRDARTKMAVAMGGSNERATTYNNNQNNRTVKNVRASEMIGESVEQLSGNDIGEIDDLVYSSADKKLLAIVSVGGFLGMGDKLVAVPYDKLSVSDGGDDVSIDMTEEQLKALAKFEYRKGEMSGKELRMNRQNNANDKRESKFSDSVIYSETRDASSQYNFRFSEIIGEDVERADGEDIGRINDIIYSVNDEKVMAIISVGGFLGIGNKLVAVPYDQIRVSVDGDDIFLDSTKESLEAMASFTYTDD